jgi:uncharacterized ferredoxin-like protein
MILNERTDRPQRVVDAACKMLTAARTAPKARGVDIIEAAVVTGQELQQLSEKMHQLGEQRNRPGMIRDAANILRGECVVIVGTRRQPIGLDCAHCGFATCESKPEQVPCAFNAIDVGIAIGSACATAADLRLDTRVMYSIGVAAQELGFLPECTLVQGIAVSASSKSPFFDRG